MSSYPRDLKSNLVEGYGVPPQVMTADNLTPTALDMLSGDGLCNIAVYLGALNDATTGAITVEESDTSGGIYTPVTLSNPLTFVGTDDNKVLRATFQRSRRFVRTPVDLSGGTISAAIAVVLQEQKKQVP